jgi:LmbE family N-acetylglucosaminyl deacetylase/tetratricopeptide (TPR) repeat protein
VISSGVLALLLALQPAPRATSPMALVAQRGTPAAADEGGVASLRDEAERAEGARRFAEAIERFERLLRARPSDLDATVHLARLSAWTGDLDRAIVIYRGAIALAPSNLGLRSDLADVLSWAQRYEDAERLYEEVLALQPSHHEALKGLARVRLLRGDLDGAGPLLDRALASFPGDPDLYRARGRLLAQRGELARGADALRRAVALAPADPEAARQLGEVLFKAGAHADALVAYQRASALEPESPHHHVMLARIQVALGHLGSAREEVATALRLAPLDAEAAELDATLRKEASALPIESLGDGLELFAYAALLPIVLVVPWRMRRGLRRRPALRTFAWVVVPSFVLLNLLLHVLKVPLARWVDERLIESISEVVLFLGVGTAFLAAVRREQQSPEFVGQSVLAVGAHPDDIELGTAGFLMKLKDSGARVYGLTMTRGEKGGDPERRPREAERATGFIGLDEYWILDLPDTGLGDRIPAMRAAIEEKIKAVGATLVLTHTDVDVHGDHRAVHAATREAARAVPTVLCYEDVSTSREFVPNYFVDISGYIDEHLKAVAFHRSQDHRTYMDPEVVRGRAAHRGMQIGASFAMAFRTLNLVR